MPLQIVNYLNSTPSQITNATKLVLIYRTECSIVYCYCYIIKVFIIQFTPLYL